MHGLMPYRPLLVVVCRAGASVGGEEPREYLAARGARWWLPDDVVFVAELPHTATGKLLQRRLREPYRDHPLPGN